MMSSRITGMLASKFIVNPNLDGLFRFDFETGCRGHDDALDRGRRIKINVL
jgi:hypothetical protein